MKTGFYRGRYNKAHELVRGTAAARTIPQQSPSPRVTDAQMSIQVDELWRAEVRKKISSLAYQFKMNRRLSLIHKGKSDLDWMYYFGLSRGYMAAARQLKGLLR